MRSLTSTEHDRWLCYTGDGMVHLCAAEEHQHRRSADTVWARGTGGEGTVQGRSSEAPTTSSRTGLPQRCIVRGSEVTAILADKLGCSSLHRLIKGSAKICCFLAPKSSKLPTPDRVIYTFLLPPPTLPSHLFQQFQIFPVTGQRK